MSKIEVNAIEPQSGTTLTLGASGDTVALAAGASQTGFGRTGTVNWSTTIRSSNFTAVSGNGYFCDTAAGSFTVTLPASPSEGDIVAIKDWSSTAATNLITIGRNGQKIEGNTTDGRIDVHGDAQTLVFSGASRGWMVVNSGLLEGIQAPQYVAATGGTVTTCGNCKVHTFTASGCFVVTCAGNDLGSNSVNYLVVAGGGGGGATGGIDSSGGGGGGAGGFRESATIPSPWTASPLASTTSLPVSATTYPVTVGGGGAAGGPATPTGKGTTGSDSIFSTITSAGGGGGGGQGNPGTCGNAISGGSGGGGGSAGGSCRTGGTGNTPPVSPPQGNSGGNTNASGSPRYGSGGGGGATAAGGVGSPTAAGSGGAGATTSISSSSTAYAGGGGGSSYQGGPAGSGGTGGGGAGNFSPNFPSSPGISGTSGTTNRGGGGGGMSQAGTGGTGGSGIVVIRYKYQ